MKPIRGIPSPKILFLCAILVASAIWLSPTRALAQYDATYDATTVFDPDEDIYSRPLTLELQNPTSDQAIVVDGQLDEEAWSELPRYTGFNQIMPQKGADASEKTETQFFIRDGYVYAAYRAYETDPSQMSAPLIRRDENRVASDWVWLFIDSNMDGLTAFAFGINPRGVLRDVKYYEDTEEDDLWDAVWEGSAQINDDGWTAEFKIPLSQLRYDADIQNHTWGINFLREFGRFRELSAWDPISPDLDSFTSQSAILQNMGSLPKTQSLEVLPYVSQELYRAPNEPGNPFYQSTDPTTRLGVDLRNTFGNGLTLSATVNPDFGQVEADPTQVNLTDNQLFFRERRPFFLEGSDIFQFGSSKKFTTYGDPRGFYSRRIGSSPVADAGDAGLDAAYEDVPRQTNIGTATKLSGRLSNGLNVGALYAFTPVVNGEAELANGQIETFRANPLSQFGVLRFKQEFQNIDLIAGTYTSIVQRDIEGTYFDEDLNRSALVNGVDFESNLGSRDYTVSGVYSVSHVQGSEAAMLDLQESSTRYYQRPDHTENPLDPTKNSLTGSHLDLSVQKGGGDVFTGSATFTHTTSGYEINDLGFQNLAGVKAVRLYSRFRNRDIPGIDELRFSNITGAEWTVDNDLESLFAGIFTNTRFSNLWRINQRVFIVSRGSDVRLTRGGPVAESPARFSLNLSLNSNDDKELSGRLQGEFDRDELGAIGYGFDLGLEWRPTQALSFFVSPEYGFNQNKRQYVDDYADPTATKTYGRRYMFADLERENFETVMRLNWTFSPTMTLQSFMRFYSTTGSYDRFKAFAEPNSLAFDEYGADIGTVSRQANTFTVDADGLGDAPAFTFGVPDFTYSSLQGNIVYRWEYRPGSALFVVWQHAKDSELEDIAAFDVWDRTNDILDSAPTNVFLLKLSYWFNR
ncbi:MAG: DUF5916 domain-containing protein [Balneolaceae bacterium]|nr:DUF5916 domain-containing protein [Balneolaceae bacterium]